MGHLTWAGWVHHSWRFVHAEALREVGPKMPERGPKTSTVPVFWAIFGIFRRDPNDLLSRLVTTDETWLYHYDPETKQQSMEWRHSGSPRPKKNSECTNPLEKFSPRFFEIKAESSSLIIFQRAKLSTRSITHLCWCNWRTFWRKNAERKATKWVLFLHDDAPAHWAFATQKKLAYLGFQCLDHPSYSPDLAPSDYHLFSGLKNNFKVRHFSSDAEVTAAVETS